MGSADRNYKSKLVDYTRFRRDDMPSRIHRVEIGDAPSLKCKVERDAAYSKIVKPRLLNPAQIVSPDAKRTGIKQTNSSNSLISDDATIEILIKRVSSNKLSYPRSAAFSRDDLLLAFEKQAMSRKNTTKEGKADSGINWRKTGFEPYAMQRVGKRFSHIERMLNRPDNVLRCDPRFPSRSIRRIASEPTFLTLVNCEE